MNVGMGLMYQKDPNRLGNTVLMTVCPESKDKFSEFAAILAPHEEQFHQIALTGIVMGSQRRAVRVLVYSDYPCVCNITGHEVPSASLP